MVLSSVTSSSTTSVNGFNILVVHRASFPSSATKTSNGTQPGSLHSNSWMRIWMVGSSWR